MFALSARLQGQPRERRSLPEDLDEVDGIVADWRRERPDLPVDAMQVWSRIHRVAIMFDAERRRVFKEQQLDNWEFDVLAALRKAGPEAKLTPGELLRETHVTSGTMTNRIERLRSRGFVTRDADPNDRRSVSIGLTPEGLKHIDAAIGELVRWEEAVLSGVAAEERQELAGQLRRLLALLR